MYFGALPEFFFYGPNVTYQEDYVRASRINDFQALVGHKIVWAYFSQFWFKGLGFPREDVLTVWRNGQLPFIRFQPVSGYLYGPPPRQEFPEQHFSLQHVIDGQFDEQLRGWARAARDLEIPILMQFGLEINGAQGPWNARWNGAGQTDGYGDPGYPDGAERYRDAYRHLVALFRGEGATNVTWFFHFDSYRQYDWWNELKWYYPGDDTIDWIGLSNYGSTVRGEPIAVFAEKLDASGVYTDFARMSERPMAIIETGVVDDSAHRKPAWIRETFSVLRSGRYPRLHGVAWWNNGTGEFDVRVQSSPDSLAAFREAIADPFFGTKPQLTGNCRPGAPTRTVVKRIPGGLRLTWSGYPNATAYEVWRDGKRIAATGALRFDDRAAKKGERHKYVVRALNPLGPGPFSKPISGRR